LMKSYKLDSTHTKPYSRRSKFRHFKPRYRRFKLRRYKTLRAFQISPLFNRRYFFHFQQTDEIWGLRYPSVNIFLTLPQPPVSQTLLKMYYNSLFSTMNSACTATRNSIKFFDVHNLCFLLYFRSCQLNQRLASL